eukprot:NODE_211_length_14581_cov_0.368941.p3 type:complete len:253 gc:universal NODE_211_length_14581_cov_0.368941:11356-12114(+)
MEAIHSILTSESIDIYQFIEAESIYNEQLIRLKKPDDLEDHTAKNTKIKELQNNIRQIELATQRTQLLDLDKQAIFEVTGIEPTGTLENSLELQEVINQKIKEASIVIDKLIPLPDQDKKGKKNEKLLVKRMVMSIQGQIKEYPLYVQRRKKLKKLMFGLQLVYNDLCFILNSSQSCGWDHWYGFDLNVTNEEVQLINNYSKTKISFTCVEEEIKMHYNGKTYDTCSPFYLNVSELLNFPTASFKSTSQGKG